MYLIPLAGELHVRDLHRTALVLDHVTEREFSILPARQPLADISCTSHLSLKLCASCLGFRLLFYKLCRVHSIISVRMKPSIRQQWPPLDGRKLLKGERGLHMPCSGAIRGVRFHLHEYAEPNFPFRSGLCQLDQPKLDSRLHRGNGRRSHLAIRVGQGHSC